MEPLAGMMGRDHLMVLMYPAERTVSERTADAAPVVGRQ